MSWWICARDVNAVDLRAEFVSKNKNRKEKKNKNQDEAKFHYTFALDAEHVGMNPVLADRLQKELDNKELMAKLQEDGWRDRVFHRQPDILFVFMHWWLIRVLERAAPVLLIGLTLGVLQAKNAVEESVAEGVKELDEAEQSLYTHQELKLESEVAEEE